MQRFAIGALAVVAAVVAYTVATRLHDGCRSGIRRDFACPATSPAHPVSTRDEAVAAAKASLHGTPLADGPFVVTHDATAWRVQAPPHPGDPAQASAVVTIDARTGRTTSYTDEVTDVALIRPAK